MDAQHVENFPTGWLNGSAYVFNSCVIRKVYSHWLFWIGALGLPFWDSCNIN